MSSYTYEAYDKSGALREGVIEASSQDEAGELLRKKGLFVTSVSTGSGKAGKAGPAKKRKGKKSVSPKIVAGFARELAVLVSTGTPLTDAISSIERQSTIEHWAGVLKGVRMRLEEGDSLTAALESEREVFNAVFRSLVAAGESSGHLDVMLQRVAMLTRKQAQIRSNVMGALMYPILLIGVAVVVIGLLVGVVLPRFADMFQTLDTPLPASTAVLMAISGFIRVYWWGVIPGIILAIVGGVAWVRAPAGQIAVGEVALRLPKLGDILRSFMTARITRLMGVLLEAKVPMLDAIELTRESVGHQRYKQLMTKAEQAVTRGDSFSHALQSSGLIVPSACEAIRNGEQTGRLSDVMVHVSDYLDEDNETIIKSLSSLIEPVIMIGMGIMVGFVAISMFLPLFDLTATAGQGG